MNLFNDITAFVKFLDVRNVILILSLLIRAFSLPGLFFYNPGAPFLGVGVRPAGEDQQG